MGSDEVERVGIRAAEKAYEKMLPHMQVITKKIVEDARDSTFMAATGEEWKDRARVKDGIQHAIGSAANSKRFLNGFWGNIGSGVVGAVVAAIAYVVGQG